MINLAAILGWDIHTIDVSQAYTQGELMETIYIHAPRTHPLPKGMVYKLLRPLYGTKQAGRCWYLHVTKTLRELGLQQATKDSCFFVQRENTCKKPNLIISVLVDDLLIMGASEDQVMIFHEKFSKVYKVSQFEKVKVYNGIHIKRTGKHVYLLSQEYSISQFLARCPVKDINPCDSPLVPSDTFVLATEKDEGLCTARERHEFQQLLGSLNWFNIATRPDLAIACSLAGRVASNNPTKLQLKQLFQILLFREIGIKLVRVPLFCDNTTSIKQMMETMSSKSNKHMEIRYAWLQHYAHREGIVQPFNIASGNLAANILHHCAKFQIDRGRYRAWRRIFPIG